MTRLVFGSVVASLLMIAPVQNVAAQQPSNQHSFAQFCRDLQAKDDFAANPDEITEFANEFSTKTQWRFDRHQLGQRGRATRLQFIFKTDQKMTAKLWTILMSGRLRAMRGEILQGETPLSLSVFTRDCVMIETRQITYLDDGRMQYVTIRRNGKPADKIWINPPSIRPKAAAKSKPKQHLRIGHIDSGIDYRRPAFQQYLIYDQAGALVARDMWDGDKLPFDASLAQGPFYPQSHGSYVVDILHQSGVGFQLLPLRYPRPDMALMSDAVDWLAAQNARIVMMPLGSQSPGDWTYFFAAANRHPEILFIISAGNNGVNLGEMPIYPAVNALENAITVTSTMPDGQLAKGSNFGIEVDIGLPAENLLARGVDAHQRMMSGSSFAVPKLTAYVICVSNAAAPNRLTGKALAQAVKSSLPPADLAAGYGLFLSDSKLDATCNPYRQDAKAIIRG
ncbi:S8 family serine peptidase [Alphaproteobacteria bacterium]|nr:S8 family serine peptidase [Alphaproteobacteria bacterium]